MVFALVILTLVFFILLDLIMRKQDKAQEEIEEKKTQPIFLSPEKSLKRVPENIEKYYHPSHTWMYVDEKGKIVVGCDSFIPYLFSGDIIVKDIKKVGEQIKQGNDIWNLEFGNKKVSQLSPVSGEILEINPAFGMETKLPSEKVAESWIMKIKPLELKTSMNNLLTGELQDSNNKILQDRFLHMHNQKVYMNDGGAVDPNFINNLDEENWGIVVKIFFPHAIQK